MDKETLRMQMLAGIITEGQYEAKLNENETVEEFENLTQLSKFEKQNKGKLKITNIDYNKETKLWTVTFLNI